MLSNKDLKILRILDISERLNISEIAKRTNLSKEVVNYRLKILRRDNYILDSSIIINWPVLGFKAYRIFLKFHNLCTLVKLELLNYFQEFPCIFKIYEISGPWNYLLFCITDDISKINLLVKSIKSKFSSYLSTNERICPLTKHSIFSNALILSIKLKKIITFEHGDFINLPLEDRKLIKFLCHNPSAPFIDIAHELNMSVSTVIRHIRRLEKSKIILGYRTNININKVKFSDYIFLIYINKSSPSKIRSLNYYVFLQPETISISEGIGLADFECKIRVQYYNEFLNFINNLNSKFPNLIKNWDIILTLRDYKVHLSPF